MIELAAILAVTPLAGFAGWRLHQLTHQLTHQPPPATSIRLRRSTVHEDWEIVGATPPPALDAAYASPRWALPELENR